MLRARRLPVVRLRLLLLAAVLCGASVLALAASADPSRAAAASLPTTGVSVPSISPPRRRSEQTEVPVRATGAVRLGGTHGEGPQGLRGREGEGEGEGASRALRLRWLPPLPVRCPPSILARDRRPSPRGSARMPAPEPGPAAEFPGGWEAPRRPSPAGRTEGADRTDPADRRIPSLPWKKRKRRSKKRSRRLKNRSLQWKKRSRRLKNPKPQSKPLRSKRRRPRQRWPPRRTPRRSGSPLPIPRRSAPSRRRARSSSRMEVP